MIVIQIKANDNLNFGMTSVVLKTNKYEAK